MPTMHRCLTALVLLLALMALFCGPIAAQTTVSVVVDTSKIAATVPVASTFRDSNGAWWSVSGTLTLKPTAPPATTGETPLPDGQGPSLKIIAYRDANGVPLGMVSGGEAVTIEGTDFGAASGEVTWGGTDPLRIDLWTNTRIVAVLPPRIPHPVGLVTVRRPDGAWGAGLWFRGGRLVSSLLP